MYFYIRALEKQQRYGLALRLLEQLNPKGYNYHKEMGNCWVQQDVEVAIQHYEKAVEATKNKQEQAYVYNNTKMN